MVAFSAMHLQRADPVVVLVLPRTNMKRASASKRGIACMCLSHYRDEGKATHTVYSGIDDPGNGRNGD